MLDEFYDLLPEKLKNGNLTGEEVDFVNYLKVRGLVEFDETAIQQLLAQASELDSKTPKRDMF